MIRSFTVLCALAAIASGLFLYSEKHRTLLLDRDIAELIDRNRAAHERIGVLKTEWQQLNDPDALRMRSDKYLKLQAVDPARYVKLADLGSRLPAPDPSLDIQTAASDAPVPVITATRQAGPDAFAQQAAPVWGSGGSDSGSNASNTRLAAADQASAILASGRSSAAGSASAPAAPAPHSRGQGQATASKAATGTRNAAPAATQLAMNAARLPDAAAKAKSKPAARRTAAPSQAEDGERPRGAPLPLAAPQPMGASVLSAMSRAPSRGYAQAPIVAASPRYAPTATVASSLSYAGHVPAPVPLPADER